MASSCDGNQQTSLSRSNFFTALGEMYKRRKTLRPSGRVTVLVQGEGDGWDTAVNIKINDRNLKQRPSTRAEGSKQASRKSDTSPKRRFPRFPLDIRVSAKVFRAAEPISLWGRSIEFGQDGIGVTLTGELEVGEVATLELTLPASVTPLKLRALVRYRDGLRHGFEFLARDDIQRDAIRRTCELLSAGQ
ncbi:MAG: PilZ domain-containing protein [Acidobacteria bacterium]|nr:PilZ domain-containing protein [Acidobacteriota bacterium]